MTAWQLTDAELHARLTERQPASRTLRPGEADEILARIRAAEARDVARVRRARARKEG